MTERDPYSVLRSVLPDQKHRYAIGLPSMQIVLENALASGHAFEMLLKYKQGLIERGPLCAVLADALVVEIDGVPTVVPFSSLAAWTLLDT